MRYAFPATLEVEADGRVTAYFDDLPGATWGDSREEALSAAMELLTDAIEMLLEDGDDIPVPSPARGRPIVEIELGQAG